MRIAGAFSQLIHRSAHQQISALSCQTLSSLSGHQGAGLRSLLAFQSTPYQKLAHGSYSGTGPRLRLLSGATVDSTAGQAAPSTEEPVYDGMPKVLVFGGNGFVGTRVCEEALATGLQIVSINRSGRPKHSLPWMDQVDWIQADVFDVASWRPQLEGTIGVISCLGAFGSNEFMYKMCGESNATVFREAAAAGVGRAAFISIADFKLPDAVLSGYFRGKRYAEQVLSETFPDGGVALRPGFIHGTRQVGSIGIPLSAIGWPLEKALSYVPTREIAKYPLLSLGFIPPVNVKTVAKAAVAAATDSVVPPGPLDVWAIQKFDEQ